MSVCISSPASVAGNTHSTSRNGKVLSGRAVVHANRSVTPGDEKEHPTNGTCGRKCKGLSPSAALQQSLENRLRARLDVNGSPEYALTWKHWDMQSGPRICALRASGRRTSDKDYSGWPTCQTRDGTHGVAQAKRAMGETRHGSNLDAFAMLAGWPTCTVEDARRGDKPPRPHDTGVPLSQRVVGVTLTGWPTCSARDWRSEQSIKTEEELYGSKGRPLSKTVLGATTTSSNARTEKPGALDPAFSRWLMGYRPEWLSCVDWETLSSRKSRQSS